MGECARTDNVFSLISEVCDGTVCSKAFGMVGVYYYVDTT